MSGFSAYSPKKGKFVLKNDYIKKGDRAHFLKAQINDNEVEILEGQSSAMLHTFAIANALVYIPSDQNGAKKGDLVETHLLPI